MKIELSDVCAGYRKTEILRHINLDFPAGQVVAVIGPNGCGKSTLLKTACGLLRPFSGDVRLDGADLYAMMRGDLARRVSYLPQAGNIPDTTVGTLVLHGRFPYLGYPRVYRAQDRALAERAMEAAGVLHLRNQALAEISGGERQKARIAMLLAQDTEAVFLDEPTTYLDIAFQIEIGAMVRKLAGTHGKAVVMVSHDLPSVFACANRIAVIVGGRVLQVGTPAEILAGDALEQAFHVRITQTDINFLNK